MVFREEGGREKRGVVMKEKEKEGVRWEKGLGAARVDKKRTMARERREGGKVK